MWSDHRDNTSCRVLSVPCAPRNGACRRTLCHLRVATAATTTATCTFTATDYRERTSSCSVAAVYAL
jgi:hypothetical protein